MQTNKVWPSFLFQGNATSFIKDKALTFCKGDGIDFGAGKWCLPGAIPVDHSTYFTIEDFDPNSLDFVYSSHCLEHIVSWKVILRGLIDKIKINGIIFLYLPHEISPWTGWRKHKWVPDCDIIANAFSEMGILLIEGSSTPDKYQSFYMVGKKRVPKQNDSEKEPKEEGYLICSRCGWDGFGKLQACPSCGAGGPSS